MIIGLEQFFTTMLNGLGQGMILVLVAAGLSIVFGMARVVNFAHGSFFMIGAYFTALLADHVGFFPALLIATLLTGAVAAVVEFLLIRPLYGRDLLLQILLTFGLALVIRELVIIGVGPTALSLSAPDVLRGSISLEVISYARYNLFLIIFGAVLIVAIDYVLRQTEVGSLIRGASRDNEMVRLLGVNIYFYWTAVFAAGAALAGLAGGLVGVIQPIQPTMDFSMLLIAFVVVVLGGMGSFRGTVVAGLLVGLVMSFTSIWWPGGSEAIALLLLAVTLLVKPEGLLGEPEVLE
jgi:branched-subunit amino acid ABC-type transport system permease component